MANSPAPALGLRVGDRERLESLTRSRTAEAGAVLRARIVLAAADGVANDRIAEQLQVSKNTVLAWRRRYGERGMAGLADAPRSGRPRQLDHRQIVATTLKPPPKKYGVTHWSSRLLAAHLGVGNATIARAWREYGVQPWRSGTFLSLIHISEPTRH